MQSQIKRYMHHALKSVFTWDCLCMCFTRLKVCVVNSAELPQKSAIVHVFARLWVGVCSTPPLVNQTNCHWHAHTLTSAPNPTKVWWHSASPPQLAPCCSPTVAWWTSCRQSSPPPLHPSLHQPVLLQPCCAAAIYCCPPSLPCSDFTHLRYTLQLSFTVMTTG